MFILRQDQADLKTDLYASWDGGSKSTICVAPTGAGKTVIMSSIAVDINEICCAMAHRQELGQQISMAMATMGLYHNIIAPMKTINTIIAMHIRDFGKSFYDPRAKLTVAGVNTLNARKDELVQWANTVRYWMGDECHHFLEENQWGRAVAMFSNARGVGFTATPIRCDRKSLELGNGGVFTDLVEGWDMRMLINANHLADYRIFGPPQSINRDDIKISAATKEFTHKSTVDIVKKSSITGDIVDHYLRLAEGKRGITFTVDVESAIRTAEAYNEAGVPAAAVSAKTPDTVRNETIRKFQNGSLLQLVNVDLFGEGFDVPAVEVVSMARPTQSFGLYAQQFGRALRTADGKTHGIIIDHVGNVKQHNLPDRPMNWTLTPQYTSRGASTRDPDIMPITTCTKCFEAFEAVTAKCPYCGYCQEPESRSEPKFIDGDLIEFSPELLALLRADIEKIDRDFDYDTMLPNSIKGTPGQKSVVRAHGNNQLAQASLRESIAMWAGFKRHQGQSDSEIYRRFWHTFGIDIMSAQGLKAKEATALTTKVTEGYQA